MFSIATYLYICSAGLQVNATLKATRMVNEVRPANTHSCKCCRFFPYTHFDFYPSGCTRPFSPFRLPDRRLRRRLPQQPRSASIIGPMQQQIIHKEHPFLVTHESLDLQARQTLETSRESDELETAAPGLAAEWDSRRGVLDQDLRESGRAPGVRREHECAGLEAPVVAAEPCAVRVEPEC